jgi:hypothetical protein
MLRKRKRRKAEEDWRDRICGLRLSLHSNLDYPFAGLGCYPTDHDYHNEVQKKRNKPVVHRERNRIFKTYHGTNQDSQKADQGTNQYSPTRYFIQSNDRTNPGPMASEEARTAF